MNAPSILEQLKQLGSEQTKKTFLNHGAREPFYGVKVEDLKKIQKKVKFNYELSMELFRSGNSDAMYLAGLIADASNMTKDDLREWADKAYWYMLSEYTVAWVASESPYGLELALEWIDSDKENIASSGWATLASLVAIANDSAIDKALFSSLLQRVSETIHTAQNRVRYAMNTFVIATGGYCSHLTATAADVAQKIGKVQVNMGGTACKVPLATEYIIKMHQRGTLGKKRKSPRC